MVRDGGIDIITSYIFRIHREEEPLRGGPWEEGI
jgi:hypothetical protein